MLTDPNNPERSETLPTLPRNGHNPTGETFYMEEKTEIPKALVKIGLLGLDEIRDFFPIRTIGEKSGVYAYKRKYKPVEKKVKPVPTPLPEEFRVVRQFPKDTL